MNRCGILAILVGAPLVLLAKDASAPSSVSDAALKGRTPTEVHKLLGEPVHATMIEGRGFITHDRVATETYELPSHGSLKLTYKGERVKRIEHFDTTLRIHRVFVGDSEFFFSSASAAATSRAAVGSQFAGIEKMTVLTMQALNDHCPKILIVDKPETAEYMVRLDRNGVFVRRSSMAIFSKAGEMVFVLTSTSLVKEAKKFCEMLPQPVAAGENPK